MARKSVRKSDSRGCIRQMRQGGMSKVQARNIRDKLISKRAQGGYLSCEELDQLNKAVRVLRGERRAP